MTTHKYWGKVEQDWAGFSSYVTFTNPFFDQQDVEIFLGEEFDEEGEEIEEPPTENQLTQFEETYQNFITNIETNLKSIQKKAYERYLKLYAHFYEDSEKSGEPALNIDNLDKHNEYIKEIMYLRVLDEKTIKVSIRYKLDTEHGLEFKFVGGQIKNVGGIAET
ncbi:hypothetical protein B0A80_01590 [Flavobacterium tructae]|uniref:DUF6985 domain-containing protein n=1 Tax=Flavobacterium tructae TaxID=1114873 RepID=UPI000B5BE30F|nr:hypothetical protein [Flavobacterium tructae]OXB25364.1 hypothetical protein B0A80_01590 [Flavobacterium tructae]